MRCLQASGRPGSGRTDPARRSRCFPWWMDVPWRQRPIASGDPGASQEKLEVLARRDACFHCPGNECRWQGGSRVPDARVGSFAVPGFRFTRRRQRVVPAGSLRGFVASCDQKNSVSFGHPASEEAGNASHEDTKTRRRQARGCSRQRSSHPLRRRVGTQPAATHPLLDRQLSCALRGDLSESRMPAWETLQCPVSVSRGTAAGWTHQAVCVCSRKGSLNVCGGLERGGWAREIQQQAHAMDPSMRCLAWPGSANGATHASPGATPRVPERAEQTMVREDIPHGGRPFRARRVGSGEHPGRCPGLP